MTRAQLEHLIRASGDIADDDEIIIIGSVGETTAIMPSGWQERLVPIKNANTRGVTGWCLDASDLGVAKLVAGREKDVRFLVAAVTHSLIDVSVLRRRLAMTPLGPETRKAADIQLAALTKIAD